MKEGRRWKMRWKKRGGGGRTPPRTLVACAIARSQAHGNAVIIVYGHNASNVTNMIVQYGEN